MPSILDPTIQRFLGGADDVAIMEANRGEQFPVVIQRNENGSPVDLSEYEVTAISETLVAPTVTAVGRITGIPSHTTIAEQDWTIAKMDPSTDGLFQVLVPSNAIDERIGAGQQSSVPFALVHIRHQRADHVDSQEMRLVVIFRRGGDTVLEAPPVAADFPDDDKTTPHFIWNSGLGATVSSVGQSGGNPVTAFTRLPNTSIVRITLTDGTVFDLDLDFVGGGLASVATDGSLLGDGSTTSPLSIAPDSISDDELQVLNTPQTNQVLSWSGTALRWKNDETGMAGGGLTQVAVDGTTILGDGTAGSPLQVHDDSIGRPQLSDAYETEIDTRHTLLTAQLANKVTVGVRQITNIAIDVKAGRTVSRGVPGEENTDYWLVVVDIAGLDLAELPGRIAMHDLEELAGDAIPVTIPSGRLVPEGGQDGQVILKEGSVSGVFNWQPFPITIAEGGVATTVGLTPVGLGPTTTQAARAGHGHQLHTGDTNTPDGQSLRTVNGGSFELFDPTPIPPSVPTDLRYRINFDEDDADTQATEWIGNAVRALQHCTVDSAIVRVAYDAGLTRRTYRVFATLVDVTRDGDGNATAIMPTGTLIQGQLRQVVPGTPLHYQNTIEFGGVNGGQHNVECAWNNAKLGVERNQDYAVIFSVDNGDESEGTFLVGGAVNPDGSDQTDHVGHQEFDETIMEYVAKVSSDNDRQNNPVDTDDIFHNRTFGLRMEIGYTVHFADRFAIEKDGVEQFVGAPRIDFRGAGVAVSGNRVTIAGGMVGGGLASVATTPSLAGDGTVGDPLGIAPAGVQASHIDDDVISSRHIGDDQIQEDHIENGEVTADKFHVINTRTNGQVLSWDENTDRMRWLDLPTTSGVNVETGPPLSGVGSFGDPLRIESGAIRRGFIALGAVTLAQLNEYQDDQNLALAQANVVLHHANPDEEGFWAGKVTAGQLAASNPAGNRHLALNASANAMEWVDAGGGSGTVATDGTIDGDGSTGDPLSLADNSVGTIKLTNRSVSEPKLDMHNSAGDGQVITWNNSQTRMEWRTPAGGGTGTVSSDSTLTGTGAPVTPLGIADGGTDQLATDAVTPVKTNISDGDIAANASTFKVLASEGVNENAFVHTLIVTNMLRDSAISHRKLAHRSVLPINLETAGVNPVHGQILSYDIDEGSMLWIDAPSAGTTVVANPPDGVIGDTPLRNLQVGGNRTSLGMHVLRISEDGYDALSPPVANNFYIIAE